MLEGPFSREWYLGERVVRQSLRQVSFMIPRSPPPSMRSTELLDRGQVREFRRGSRAVDFLAEGDYEAFVAGFLMRPFSVSMPPPAPGKGDEAGPSGAPVQDDEPSADDSGDGPTDEDWRVMVQDVYGGEFTHHI